MSDFKQKTHWQTQIRPWSRSTAECLTVWTSVCMYIFLLHIQNELSWTSVRKDPPKRKCLSASLVWIFFCKKIITVFSLAASVLLFNAPEGETHTHTHTHCVCNYRTTRTMFLLEEHWEHTGNVHRLGDALETSASTRLPVVLLDAPKMGRCSIINTHTGPLGVCVIELCASAVHLSFKKNNGLSIASPSLSFTSSPPTFSLFFSAHYQ